VGKKSDKQSGLVRVTGRVTSGALKIAQAPQTLRERLNKLLLPVAWVIGALGIGALLACVLLRYLPEEQWPSSLDPDAWAFYTLVSLVSASMLGWGCMQMGMKRVRRLVGWRPGGVLLVLLPIVCVIVSQLIAHEVLVTEAWPARDRVATMLRWYPPGVVALSLVAFLAGELVRGRDEDGRRLGHGLLMATFLVLPYAILMASLFGVAQEFVDLPITDTLHELGTWAVVLQIVLAYFFSPSSAG
jgi:hypothetical protein